MSDSPISDEQLDRLYQQLEPEQPPADLDAEIRAHARRPLQPEAPNVTPRRHGLRRWGIPLSTAAVMVLGLSLFFRAYEQQSSAPAPASTPTPAAELLQEPAPAVSDAAGAAVPETGSQAKAEARSQAMEAAPIKKRMLMQAPPAPASVQKSEQESAADQAAPAEAPVMGLMSRAGDQQAQQPEARRMLQAMETLLQNNQPDQLEKAYRDFRKKYPHYPLSPALQEWYKRQQPDKTPAPASQTR